MKLSTRGRYALRLMLDIYRMGRDGRPVRLAEVAERTGVSRRYLEQLVISLKNASLLRGVSGRNGGYLLSKEADEIRILEIVEAAIGPIDLVDCVGDSERCGKSGDCECRLVWCVINRKIKEILGRYSLSDLADPKVIEELGLEIIGNKAGAKGTLPGRV